MNQLVTTNRPLRPATWPEMAPGSLVWFRCNGLGDGRYAVVLPAGPLGQFYISFCDACGNPFPNGRVAASPYNEVWVEETAR